MHLKKFLKKNLTTKKIAFFGIFFVLALVAQRINFSALVGAENQFFTLFQFFAPVAGIFLGPFLGITAVLLAEVSNHLLQGSQWTLLNMLRLIPVLFATFYFGSRNKKRLGIFIPAMAIVMFLLHPVGRTVWFFTLYWTIPMLPYILPKKYGDMLMLKSLGATFTQHAVGGALWIWTVPMTASQWIGLIPVIAYERGLFALGMAFTYILFNTILAKLDEKWTSGAVEVDKKYAFA